VVVLALILGLAMSAAGCSHSTPTILPSTTPSPTRWPTVTPTLTLTPTKVPTPTPTSTPTPTPTATPHPLEPYTIEGLRARDYPGGTVEVQEEVAVTSAYTRYLIAYPSDGLTITGVMQVPHGEGPFPVIILNHGYIPPERYVSGSDTWRPADYLAQHGYLTLAPDFRGWGGSDSGDDFFHGGLVIDALNLVSSLPSLPQANSKQVGMWGHSMGGGVTARAMVIDPRIKAAVLYAPVSANYAEVIERWTPEIPEAGETDDPRWASYRQAMGDPLLLGRASPINYFDLVTAPVQIHQGTADTSTPPEWAEAIHAALLAAGKEVEYYTYEGQGHAFQGQAWTVFLERVRAFFDQHVGQ